jgi:hypothetical protein
MRAILSFREKTVSQQIGSVFMMDPEKKKLRFNRILTRFNEMTHKVTNEFKRTK